MPKFTRFPAFPAQWSLQKAGWRWRSGAQRSGHSCHICTFTAHKYYRSSSNTSFSEHLRLSQVQLTVNVDIQLLPDSFTVILSMRCNEEHLQTVFSSLPAVGMWNLPIGRVFSSFSAFFLLHSAKKYPVGNGCWTARRWEPQLSCYCSLHHWTCYHPC